MIGLRAFRLSNAERTTLLSAARDAIESVTIQRPEHPSGAESEGRLAELGACFVTLVAPDNTLRGCVGSLSFTRSLSAACRAMAVAAATRDPRFPPLEKTELSGVRVNLSVLSPPTRIASIAEIEVGRHGVVVQRGDDQGVLLPQVASDQGWDGQTFAENTCRKAGIDPATLDDGRTTLEVFDAEVFSEPRSAPVAK